MTGQLLSSAPLAGLEAFEVFNRPVFESHEQIADVLERRLGPQHAAVFARPELADGRIGWWTDLPGRARRWSELGTAERARLEPTRLQLGEEIARLTADLSRAGINTPRGNLSQILHAALEVPGIEHLYVVDDQPVLTFWGFRGAGGDGVNGLAPLPEAALAAALAPAARRRLWPWLLLAALLLALLAAFLAWWFLLRNPQASVVEPQKTAFPEDRWAKKDISLLEGCWNRITDLQTTDINTKVVYPVRAWRMCFDRAGGGHQELEYPNGERCAGPLHASFASNGDLKFEDDGDITCNTPRRIFKSIGQCQRVSDDEADCLGEQPAVNVRNIPWRIRRAN
ncbi:MAG: hypothetical protein ACLQME_24255 [Alphaproteobacteria bacterium]